MIKRNIRPTGAFDASLILLMLIVVFLIGGGIFTFTYLRQDPVEEILSGDRVINTLFVIENQGEPLASYVLMHYSDTGKAAIFDVPSSIGLILKGIKRVDRIAAVYNPGKIIQFETEIEGLLGIEISFSVIIDTEQLGRMVDLLGGVEIFIPAPVSIYDTEPPVFFPSGLTRLDGDKARSFITYEFPEEDPDLPHFRRQRFFLGLIKRQGEQQALLKNPAAASYFQTMLKTDMSTRMRTHFFDRLAALDVDRMNIQTVGGNVREVSGQHLLFPYYDGSLIKEIVRQSLSALTRRLEGDLTERVFTVEVLNGTSSIGLARRTAELLGSFGYDVISIGNADHSDYWITQIIDRSGLQDAAGTFAEIIRCENILFAPSVSGNPAPDAVIDMRNLEYKADFTLIIGRDFNGRYVAGG